MTSTGVSAVNTTLYLDLEGTVIKGWDDQVLMNSSRVRDFLDSNPDIDRDDVRVFSFAIYNDKDKAEFVRDIKPMLERRLGVTITQWHSVQDMALRTQQLTGNRFLDSDTMGGHGISEYIALVGKVNAFLDWVVYEVGSEDGPGSARVVLVDDIVPMRTVLDHTLGLQVDYINVDKLGV